jgi:hypothetical protein
MQTVLRPRSSGLFASVKNPPVLVAVLSGCRPRAGASAPVRRRQLDLRAETPVSSGAVAFDLVRRESVWQRAGPSEGVSPRTNPRRIPGSPGAGRTQDHQGDPRPGSAGDHGEGRSTGVTFGPHRARTPRRVIPPEPKPHERDRMKHAGRPRRGVTRPGREKRRRRNEASVEARDEEPDPIGTCTPANLFGGAAGAVFRPPSVERGELRLSASGEGVGGRPVDVTHGPSRTGSRRRPGAAVPLGEQPQRVDERTREGPDAMGRCRSLGEPRGGPSSDGWPDGSRPPREQDLDPAPGAGTRCPRGAPSSGSSPAGRLSCRRTPAVPAWKGPPGSQTRLLRQPIRRWSGRDGDADHGDASTQRSRLRAAGRNTAARRPHGRTRDLAPGSELSRVGALEGRRTSWEDAWERPVGVGRTASRPISRLGP